MVDPTQDEDEDDSPDTDTTPDASDDAEAPAPINPVVAQYLKSKQDLAAAQNTASGNQLIAGLARAGGTLAHSAYGSTGPVNSGVYDALDQSAQAPVANLLNQQKSASQDLKTQSDLESTQIQNEESDADSDRSKTFRALIKSNFPKIAEAYGDDFDDITASDAPSIMKVADTKAAIDQRAEAAKERYGLQSEMAKQRVSDRQTANDAKQSAADEKTQSQIGKELNDLTASGRSTLGVASKAKVAAQRLKDIVSDPNATNQDLQSAYSDLNSIVSGAATVSGSAHQAYNTVANKWAGLKQYLTGSPSAPVIPEIKQHVADVASRMAAISDNVIKQNTIRSQAAHSGWINRNPDQWQDMLSAASGEGSLAQAGGGGPTPAAQGPQPIARQTKDGRTALFDPTTKQFLRYQ